MTYVDTLREREPLADHCGIIIAYASSDIAFFVTGLSGLLKEQTRGIDGAGIYARTSNGEIFNHKGRGMIHEAFSEDVVSKFRKINARSWLLQTRYGTNGSGHSENIQPITKKHVDGSIFAVVVNGEFSSEGEVDESGKSDTVIFAEQLSGTTELYWDERILAMQELKKGAWSMGIDTPEGIYLTRDEHGVRPFVYGFKLDSSGKRIWIAASESAALVAMGVKKIWEVLPGSVVKINEKGPTILKCSENELSSQAVCIFENVYLENGHSKIHRPRRDMFQINLEPTVASFREKCGQILAFEEKHEAAKHTDFVVGIPGTGIAGGRVYAQVLGIPYIQAIVDRRPQEYDARTFMTPNIDEIPDKIKGHFHIERSFFKGAKVVLVDDSLVRGNISTGLALILRECGVNEIHLRILCPPIDKPCYLGINTRTNDELIAYRHNGDIEKIRQELGVDSLAFLSDDEGLLGAAGTREGFCMGCMIGHHPPIDRKGNVIYEQGK